MTRTKTTEEKRILRTARKERERKAARRQKAGRKMIRTREAKTKDT